MTIHKLIKYIESKLYTKNMHQWYKGMYSSVKLICYINIHLYCLQRRVHRASAGHKDNRGYERVKASGSFCEAGATSRAAVVHVLINGVEEVFLFVSQFSGSKDVPDALVQVRELTLGTQETQQSRFIP